jgi:hypothetical protein
MPLNYVELMRSTSSPLTQALQGYQLGNQITQGLRQQEASENFNTDFSQLSGKIEEGTVTPDDWLQVYSRNPGYQDQIGKTYDMWAKNQVMEENKRKMEAYQTDFNQISEKLSNGELSAQDIAEFTLRHPDQAEHIQKVNSILTDEQKQNAIRENTELFSALNLGDKEYATNILQERIDALSKDDPKANKMKINSYKAMRKAIEEETGQGAKLAMANIALNLNSLQGNKDFSESFGDMQKMSAPGDAPAEIQKLEWATDPKNKSNPAAKIFLAKYQRENPGTQVTIDMGKSATEGRTQLEKGYANKILDVGEKAELARENQASVNTMRNLNNAIETGKLAEAKSELKAWAEAVGVNVGDMTDVTNSQAFRAQSNKIVLQYMQAQKGPQTESDMKQIRTTVAKLGNTKEANTFLLNAMEAQNQRTIEQDEFYSDWVTDPENEGKPLSQSIRDWNKHIRDVPMVSSSIQTEQGQPMFFYEFERRAKETYPDITREDIVDMWKEAEGKKKIKKAGEMPNATAQPEQGLVSTQMNNSMQIEPEPVISSSGQVIYER